MKIMVTGGAGFIGSAVIRHLIHDGGDEVINVDKLTYAANLESLSSVENSNNYCLEIADICDSDKMADIFKHHQPDAVMHLAAESHVDRSIDGPDAFIQTNIVGTYQLLDAAHQYFKSLSDAAKRQQFRFHHVSTDEVFGALKPTDPPFNPSTAYDPRSPYSASKASSDHLVMAWLHTYGLPVVLSNCSNNYGPHQFPEKLIPLIILNALENKPLPVYGKGENIRDWLHVDDHAQALVMILKQGRIGENYLVGGDAERTNLDVVRAICDIMDILSPIKKNSAHRELIEFVTDRPGHDLRYAIDTSKIRKELGWAPQHDFKTGLQDTVKWYLENENWWRPIQDGQYQGQRLGLNTKQSNNKQGTS